MVLRVFSRAVGYPLERPRARDDSALLCSANHSIGRWFFLDRAVRADVLGASGDLDCDVDQRKIAAGPKGRLISWLGVGF